MLVLYYRNVEAFIASQDVLFNTFNERGDTMSRLVQYDPIAQLSALQRQFFGDNWYERQRQKYYVAANWWPR